MNPTLSVAITSAATPTMPLAPQPMAGFWSLVLTRSSGWKMMVEQVPLTDPARNALTTGVRASPSMLLSFLLKYFVSLLVNWFEFCGFTPESSNPLLANIGLDFTFDFNYFLYVYRKVTIVFCSLFYTAGNVSQNYIVFLF